MPPKRKSTGTPRTASSQRQQSTLSFGGKNSKVTKTASPRSTKATKKDPALFDDVEIKPNVEQADIEQSEKPIEVEADDPLEPTPVKTEDILGGRAEESTSGATDGPDNSGWLSDEASQARKIPQTQINRYWRAKEQERKAPRVHQQDLSVSEKILREWDMSNQYGPAIGIARLKRWKRANMLGLEPPIEVLAVLLKDMDDGERKMQRAYVDELMSSRFVEA